MDLTLDSNNISVYKCKNIVYKDKQSQIQVEQIEKGNNSILKDLGVKDSSVFLSNCTIWVEEITDRLYIRKYLELYQKYMFNHGKIQKIFKEDINYSFLEYSGGNITHWSFFDEQDNLNTIKYEYITKNIFLIEDNDCVDKDSQKYKRNKVLKKRLKENYYQLKCREIENLINIKILKK